jgi:hypothetical protein
MKGKNELFLDNSLDDRERIGVGRLKYSGSGAFVYLPKDIVNSLNLKRNHDTSLVIVSYGDRCTLIKDTIAAQKLKAYTLDKHRESEVLD